MIFKKRNKDADRYKAILYGSLAKTGKGHCTDEVIRKTFFPYECKVEFNCIFEDIPHPNTMELISYKKNVEQERVKVFSIGGGYIEFENMSPEKLENVYPHDKFTDIANYCEEHSIKLWQYALKFEGEDLKEHIAIIWDAMKRSIKNGLNDEGTLPGGLEVQKKAKTALGLHLWAKCRKAIPRATCTNISFPKSRNRA